MFALAAPRHRASRAPRGTTAHRERRTGVRRVRPPLPDQAPEGRRPQRHRRGPHDLETLLGGIKAAKLDTGEHISAGLARRIACEAGIIPAVLGGKSEVLDLGRSRASTPGPNGSRPPSNKAAASSKATTAARVHPDAPPDPLVHGRPHRRRRLDALPTGPPTSPTRATPTDESQRQDPIPQTGVRQKPSRRGRNSSASEVGCFCCAMVPSNTRSPFASLTKCGLPGPNGVHRQGPQPGRARRRGG